MLTQMMPALIDALRQVLPPEAIGPLSQSLGNCAQPLTHRAGVNLPGTRRLKTCSRAATRRTPPTTTRRWTLAE